MRDKNSCFTFAVLSNPLTEVINLGNEGSVKLIEFNCRILKEKFGMFKCEVKKYMTKCGKRTCLLPGGGGGGQEVHDKVWQTHLFAAWGGADFQYETDGDARRLT